MPTKTETYAPSPGDPEFDPIWDKVQETLTAGDSWDADTAAPIHALAKERGIDPPQAAREILAEALVKYGGKKFTPGIATDPTDAIENTEWVEPTELHIPPRPVKPYWYDDPADARIFEHYVLSRRALGNALHGGLVITGPAGVGKTMGVVKAIDRINAANGLDIRLTVMNCSTVTDKGKWFGRREADETGTHFIDSDFVTAVQRGDAILLDDLARLHPDIHNPIFSLLDGLEEVHISDLNVTIKRHPETVFIATMNQGSQYGGQHRMDWAFRERFPITIERGFPPRDEEVRILTSYWPDCASEAAEGLVDVARRTRDMHLTGDLRNVISTRDLIAAAWLVASGATEREALSVSALPLFDGDANGLVGQGSDRQKVSGILEGRFKRG